MEEEYPIEESSPSFISAPTPFLLELRPSAKPKTLVFQRKTKAGLWENLMVIENIIDIETAICTLRAAMVYRRLKYNKNEGHRIVTYSGYQVFSSYYQKFSDQIVNLLNDKIPFGLSINKGETYLMCFTSKFLPNEARNTIAEYFSKLSHDHGGIRKFKYATPDLQDNFLSWGWMIFNDEFKISVAFDLYFDLYKKFKSNFNNPFLLKK